MYIAGKHKTINGVIESITPIARASECITAESKKFEIKSNHLPKTVSKKTHRTSILIDLHC
jgi:hypothetical protein